MPHSRLLPAGLEALETRFRLLVESVKDYAICMLNEEGYIATWNSGAERLKGYTVEEIIGEHFSQFYTAEDNAAGKPQRELAEARASGRVEDEAWRVRKDGSRFWALVVTTALRDEKGRLIGFGQVTRDLTSRKTAEERLRKSEEQFRTLVAGIEDYAIYMLNPEGRVVTWNAGAEKLKGYRAVEIIGKSFVCFYTPEEVAAGKPQRNLQNAINHGHARDQGLRVRKDGSTFIADVAITTLRDPTGTLRGFAKVTRDITDRIRIREMEAEKLAAERANQAKDDFLAALSHELRTPLTPALAAATYLVENAAELPPECVHDLEIVRRNIQLEARLIDDLLDLTRIARGKLELRLQQCDAHDLIREALATAGGELAQKNLSISTSLAATRHLVSVDPVRMRQVFWNLINNAVKFTNPGGNIQICTSNDASGQFAFEIVDTGLGIEPELLGSLFTAFEQGERAVTRQFGGLGLGLAIARNIVERHGGSIGAESAGRNRGATFRVTLNVLPDEMLRPDPPRAGADHPPNRLRILLVEDHGDTRQVLARLLARSGHEICAADSVAAARDLCHSQNFDAVLSDIGLPDGTGYDVIAEAKRRHTLKGIALSGFGMEQDVRRSKEAGFDFHLTKPVDFSDLQAVLRQIES